MAAIPTFGAITSRWLQGHIGGRVNQPSCQHQLPFSYHHIFVTHSKIHTANHTRTIHMRDTIWIMGTQQISTIIRVYHKSIFKSANSLINSIISLLSIISPSKLHGHANKIKPKVGSNIQYSKLHCSLNSSMCPHGEPGSIHGRRRWAE
jgi:hypothetical protein